MAKRKILVTGAVGKIAGQILPAFQKHHEKPSDTTHQ